jgi:hypothetical protein
LAAFDRISSGRSIDHACIQMFSSASSYHTSGGSGKSP